MVAEQSGRIATLTERVALSGGRRRLVLRWRWRWVVAALGGGGLLIANAASSASSSVVVISPVRILDTRDPVNVGLNGPFVSAVSQKLQVTGSVATNTGNQIVVPLGATGVLLNVTASGATASGFVSIRPGDATGAPSTSSLNVNAGVTVPNAVTVALPTTGPNAGKIDITFDAYGVAGPITEVLIDVVGYTIAPSGPVIRYAKVLGAVALDLCLVAAGVLDGYVDCVDEGHGVWDYLASVLICREAGAAVTDLHDRELSVLDHSARRTLIAAATPELSAQLKIARRHSTV